MVGLEIKFNDNYISSNFYELSQFVEILEILKILEISEIFKPLKMLTRKFQNLYQFDICHFMIKIEKE
jgi:hypothetical protein